MSKTLKTLLMICLIAFTGGFIFLAVLEDYKEKQYKLQKAYRKKKMETDMRRAMQLVNS